MEAKEFLEKWIFQLRSGEHRQIKFKPSDGEGGYCAQGLIQHIQGLKINTKHSSLCLPDEPWIYEDNGLHNMISCIWRLNDGYIDKNIKEHSFIEIADYIENWAIEHQYLTSAKEKKERITHDTKIPTCV